MNLIHIMYAFRLPAHSPFRLQQQQQLTIGTKSKVAFASIQNNLKLSKIEISMKMMRCVMNLTLLVFFFCSIMCCQASWVCLILLYFKEKLDRIDVISKRRSITKTKQVNTEHVCHTHFGYCFLFYGKSETFFQIIILNLDIF